MTDRIETVIDRAVQSCIRFDECAAVDARIIVNKKLEELPKLLPETKRQWVKDLRRGMFKQASRYLFVTETGYCCLGVYGMCLGMSVDEMKFKSFLPSNVFTKTLADPLSYREESTQQIFSYLNDVYKLSFYDIATIIEEYC
jgi:hypothetical protein